LQLRSCVLASCLKGPQLFTVFLFLLASPVFGQSQSTALTPEQQVAGEILTTDKSTRKAYAQYLTSVYKEKNVTLGHRRNLFQWQLLSTKIIFATVIFLVAAGICFAAIQFYVGLRRNPRGGSGESKDITEIKASLQGIRVSSSVLGVIILTLSLLFFYLYIKYVYPINNEFTL
jgi:hypothetical protein